MKGENIFIIQTDIVCCNQNCSYQIQAFQNKEDAQKYFNKLVKFEKEKREIKRKDWVIDKDSETSFEAFEYGYYSYNHIVITLMTIKIQ